MEGISQVVPRGGRGRRPAGGFGREKGTSFPPGKGSTPVSPATCLVLIPGHRSGRKLGPTPPTIKGVRLPQFSCLENKQ
ncbi:hypothetical protein C4D60_Mb08t18040 [Musa balbisiana]|uniref:Uncharacterized protein n=1 Tax=Musa balbisiana TaxID=52838 RepID=A0A4S8K4N7_MUSBA|nr:hypothetical protein C4D60_Mb08t18040 [Musa balbisiana]